MAEEEEETSSVVSSLSGGFDTHPELEASSALRSLHAPITLADEERLKDIFATPHQHAILKPSITGKIDGQRYICLVRHDGNCELIASTYAPHELTAHQSNEILMILDGELVSLSGSSQSSSMQDESKNTVDYRFGNIFVIFDVLTKEGSLASRVPVAERLKTLELLLWTGDCKVCGVDVLKKSTRPDQSERDPAESTVEGHLPTTTPKCSTCNYGLKLKHPWFIRAVVKRTVPFELAKMRTFRSCCVGDCSSCVENSKEGNMTHVKTSLYDGCILQVPAFYDGVDEQGAGGGIGEACYKIKSTPQLTADLKLNRFLNFKAWKESPETIQLLAEGTDDKGQNKYQIEFPEGMSTATFLHFLSEISKTSLELFDCFVEWGNYFVECTHIHGESDEFQNEGQQPMVKSRWLFRKFRPDKTVANSAKLIATIASLTKSNTVNVALVNLLLSERLDETSSSNVDYRTSSVLTCKDLLWETTGEGFDMEMFLNLEEQIKFLFHQRMQLAVTTARNLDIFGSPYRESNSIYSKTSCFHYYIDAVKRWMYSMFESATIIDLGSGKLKLAEYWRQHFEKVIGIESNPKFVELVNNDKGANNNVVVISQDASHPDIKSSLKKELNGSQADCCFAMFALQGVMSTRSKLDNFLLNLLPNLKSDGYLIAMMLDGDEVLNSLGIYGSQSFTLNGIVLDFDRNAHSWAGITVRHYNRDYNDPGVYDTDVVATGLANRQSNLNCAMADRGFELQSVFSLDQFTHLLPTYEAMYFDAVSAPMFHRIISLYKCVIWRRVGHGKFSTDEEVVNEGKEDEANVRLDPEIHGPEANVTLMQLLCGENYHHSAVYLSEATLSLLIHDFLDIRSHFQLAMSCKSILRHYLRGSPSGASLYSMRAIRSGLHIRQTVKYRENPLFLINYLERSDMENRQHWDDEDEEFYDHEFPPLTPTPPTPPPPMMEFPDDTERPRFQSCCFRILNPNTYFWLQSIACIDGCAGCSCVLKDFQQVAENKLKIDFNLSDNDYYDIRRLEPTLTAQQQQDLINQGKSYYPFPVDSRAMFCMCQKCLFRSFETSPRQGYNYRATRLFYPMHKALLNRNCMTHYHYTSQPTSLMSMMILKSLFTKRMNVNAHFPQFEANCGEEQKRPAHRTPLESLLAELVPEVFGFDQNGHGRCRSSSAISYLTKVRESLDDNFLQVWMVYEYALAVELMHRGPPFPTFAVEKCRSRYSVPYGEHPSGDDVVPYPEAVMISVMEQIQHLIRAHASWNERWAALRFRSNKRQHAYEFFREFVEEDSEGDELTDITPFHTAIW